MEKSKLLPVIAAIMITSMAVSMLSISTTTVSATHNAPTATITPTRVKENAEKVFTIMITNTGGDKIDNVKITLPRGFSGLTSTATIGAGDNIYLGPGTGENQVVLKAGTVVMLYKNAQIGLYENTIVIRAAGENIYIENNAGQPEENGVLIENLYIKLLGKTVETKGAENGLDNNDNVRTTSIRAVTLSGGDNENVVAVLAATTVVYVSSGGVYRFADNTDVKILNNILVSDNTTGLLENDNVVTTIDRGIVVDNGRSTNPSAFTCKRGSTSITMTIAAGSILGLGWKDDLDNRAILPAGTTVRLAENVQVQLGKDTTVSKTAGENITSLTAVTKPENWTFNGTDTWTTTVADRMIAAGGSAEFTFAATTSAAGGDKTFMVTTTDNVGGANGVRTVNVTPDVFVDNVAPVVTSVTVSKEWAKANDAVVITVVASEEIVPSENWVAVAEGDVENIPVTMTSANNITWTGTYTTGDNVLRDGVATITVVNDNFKDLVDHSGSGENVVTTLKVDRRKPPIPSATYGGLTTLTTPTNQSSQTITVYAFDNRYDNNVANGIYENVAGMTVKIRVGTTTVNRTADSTGKVVYPITLSEGSNEVGVGFVDLAGNESENENVQTVICDTVKPSITLTSIGGVSAAELATKPTKDNTPMIILTISDATLGVENEAYGSVLALAGYKVELRRDNDNAVLATLTSITPPTSDPFTSFTFENQWQLDNALPDNTYNIFVQAGDNFQQENVYFRFTIDTKKPLTTDIVFAADYSGTTLVAPHVQKTTTLSLSGTISASEVGGVIKVYVDGVLATSVTTTTTAWSASITLTAGSTQKVEVTLTDVAGNESDKRLYGYFMADGSAPTVTISSPATGTSTDKTSIQITGKVTKDTWEDYTDLTVNIQVGGATPGVVTLDASGNFTSSATLGEGTNVITITARDAAGNLGSAAITIERTVTSLTIYAIILVVVALILAAIAIFRKEMK